MASWFLFFGVSLFISLMAVAVGLGSTTMEQTLSVYSAGSNFAEVLRSILEPVQFVLV
jgi:hypothetical protein